MKKKVVCKKCLVLKAEIKKLEHRFYIFESNHRDCTTLKEQYDIVTKANIELTAQVESLDNNRKLLLEQIMDSPEWILAKDSKENLHIIGPEVPETMKVMKFQKYPIGTWDLTQELNDPEIRTKAAEAVTKAKSDPVLLGRMRDRLIDLLKKQNCDNNH